LLPQAEAQSRGGQPFRGIGQVASQLGGVIEVIGAQLRDAAGKSKILFVPVFFVATGVRFDLTALFANATNLLRVPIFLAALLIVRGLPALLYGSLASRT